MGRRSGIGTIGLVALGVIAVGAIYQLNKSGGQGVANDVTGVTNNAINNVFKS